MAAITLLHPIAEINMHDADGCWQISFFPLPCMMRIGGGYIEQYSSNVETVSQKLSLGR
jgi:hypothetical protein